MSDTVSINRRAVSLDIAPEFDGYSGIIINVDEENQISAGDITGKVGRVLTMDNPQGTQDMANTLLEKLRGRQYQPYKAEGALLDPAAEIGDGVSIKDTYGGIYSKVVSFSRLMSADISAPADEEIDHEFKYESPQEKQTKRELGDIRATLIVQANEIAAKVSQTGGDNSSFGWSLLSNKFSLYAGDKEVFKATSSGVEIDGKITAREGYIGNGSSGFKITSTAIYNNLDSLDSKAGNGIYIGTNGIRLGQNFKVTDSGHLTASSGTFSGTIYAGNLVVGGGNKGYLPTACIGGGSIAPGKLTSTGQTGIGGGNKFKDMDENKYKATNVRAKTGYFDSLGSGGNFACQTLYIGDNQCSLGTITVDGHSYNVVRWR